MEICSKRVGHALGRALVAASIGGTLVAVVRKWRATRTLSTRAQQLLAGSALLTAFASGVRLLNKLYLRDPEAVAEYCRELTLQPFSRSLRRFRGLAKILEFESSAAVHDLVLRQVLDAASDGAAPSLLALEAAVEADAIRDLRDFRVFSTRELRLMFAEDVAAAKTFTALWDRASGALEPLHRLGLIDLDACRALVVKEFDWVDASGRPCATAPSAEDVAAPPQYQQQQPHCVVVPPRSLMPGGHHGVFAAVAAYGAFLLDPLGFDRAWLRHVLEASAEAATQPLSELSGAGTVLVALASLGVISRTFVDNKFLAELRGPGGHWDLRDLQRRYMFEALLDAGVLSAELVQPAFWRSLPCDGEYHNGARLSKPAPRSNSSSSSAVRDPRCNVIAFVREWSRLLTAHPAVVPPALVGPLGDARSRYEDALRRQKSSEARVAALKEEAAKKKASIVSARVTAAVAEAAAEAHPSRHHRRGGDGDGTKTGDGLTAKERQLLKRERQLLADEARVALEKAAVAEKESELELHHELEAIQREFVRAVELSELQHGIDRKNARHVSCGPGHAAAVRKKISF